MCVVTPRTPQSWMHTQSTGRCVLLLPASGGVTTPGKGKKTNPVVLWKRRLCPHILLGSSKRRSLADYTTVTEPEPNAGKHCRERKKVDLEHQGLLCSHITDAVPAAGFAAIEKCTRGLSAQRCLRRSLLCLAKQNSCLHLEPKSQNHRSVCGACGACPTLWGAPGH